ncbi:class I SAM-dependent methyltransferase [Agrobacterium sp. M50-1]|uniref:class I SAM-dependent methyltransferase n=1 Tax=Agrobacterium sp. M50-1 TaxID=3132821 RepID=UPI003CE4544B
MYIDGYEFVADTVAKFHHALYISGWFHHPDDALKSVILHNAGDLKSLSDVQQPHGGVSATLGENKGFWLHAFRGDTTFPQAAEIEFISKKGKSIRVNLGDLAKDRTQRYQTVDMSRRFVETVSATPGAKVLDIGGRARSKLDRSKSFPNSEVTVFDVMAGDNVDVVGDAHDLSKYFAPETFDFVYSVSVFEHLLMPWRVVTEMNKVLKVGGIGYVHTHQTLGMHDAPWDFWRFSDTSWDALFNAKTGFEITERVLDSEQFVIPFVYRPSKEHAERSAGFEGSAVVFRKVGPSQVEWATTLSELVDTSYPDNDDGRTGGTDYI